VTFLTHIFCVSSWIMGDGQLEKIYWLLMNFPDNFLTSCTSIEQGNLLSSSIGKIYYINTGIVTFLTHILCVSSLIMGDRLMNQIYHFLWTFQINCSWVALLLSRATYLPVPLEKCCINTGIVTFLTHILCVSSWIMGEGQMEKIYWLLMNFPDKLLMSCTSIEQGNLPSSHIGKIYYINTGIVTFLTHILCVSSWIMGEGQMENICWLLMNFTDKLLTSCTSIEQGNLSSSSIEKYVISTPG
jgi:hypothetical protein